MMLAQIMPAFLGTDLHTFECRACNHVIKTLGAYEDPMQSGNAGAAFRRFGQRIKMA
jgi:hypothetical protein